MKSIKSILINNKSIYPFLTAIRSLRNKEIRENIWNFSHNKDSVLIEHRGDLYNGKIIYDLHIDDGLGGFFALVRWVCTALTYADNKGLVPYVSFGEKCRYFDESIAYTKNPFEYYFNPVSSVTAETVAKASNVIRFETNHLKEIETDVSFQLDDKVVEQMVYIWKKYISLNDKTKASILSDISSVMDCSEKTLAVHVRGTDFKKNYSGHPVAISLDEEIAVVKELKEKGGYKQIFLATDEAQTVEKFTEVFGKDIVKFYSQTYRSVDGTAVHTSVDGRENHKYLLGYEVLRDVITLASCAGFVAGVSNVSLFVTVINKAMYKEFEDCHICYHGMNSNSKIYNGRK